MVCSSGMGIPPAFIFSEKESMESETQTRKSSTGFPMANSLPECNGLDHTIMLREPARRDGSRSSAPGPEHQLTLCCVALGGALYLQHKGPGSSIQHFSREKRGRRKEAGRKGNLSILSFLPFSALLLLQGGKRLVILSHGFAEQRKEAGACRSSKAGIGNLGLYPQYR